MEAVGSRKKVEGLCAMHRRIRPLGVYAHHIDRSHTHQMRREAVADHGYCIETAAREDREQRVVVHKSVRVPKDTRWVVPRDKPVGEVGNTEV